MSRWVLLFGFLVGCNDYEIIGDPGAQDPEDEDPTVVEPDVDIDTDDPGEDVSRPDCGNAGDRKVMFARIEYPQRRGCRWEADDNRSRINGQARAYESETRAIDMPTGARVCDLALKSLTDDLWFDDSMTLLLQDGVIVGGGSGYEMTRLPADPDGFVPWNWEAIVDAPHLARDRPYWCLGDEASTCIVPGHDLRGPLEIDIPADVLDPFTARVEQDATMEISLLTFGDNDDSDCSHSDVVLEATITWVQQ